MKETIFGTIAFILFIMYDLEQAGAVSHRFHKITKFLFTIGSLMLVGATVHLLWKSNIFVTDWTGRVVASLIPSKVWDCG